MYTRKLDDPIFHNSLTKRISLSCIRKERNSTSAALFLCSDAAYQRSDFLCRRKVTAMQ